MILRVILGDQLSHDLPTFDEIDQKNDLIWMCEVQEEATYVKHHKKKIAFIFSAMRHFGEELKEKGYNVHYTKLDDAKNAGSFEGEIKRAVQDHNPDKIIITEPSEYRVLENIKTWKKKFKLDVDILGDTRFLAKREGFVKWAQG